MSMTLILWKAPIVGDPDEAAALLDRWYSEGDDSGFTPSEDVGRMAADLRRRYPDYPAKAGDDSPWADLPFDETDRLLELSIRWGADDDVIDLITRLARKHGLLLYDPQGPEVYLPTDSADADPTTGQLGFGDYFKTVLILLASATLFAVGWTIEVPVINWILMIVGGFLTSVCFFLLTILIFAPRELPDEPASCQATRRRL